MRIGRQVRLGGLLVAAMVAGVIVTLALGLSQAGTSQAGGANGAMAVDCNASQAGVQSDCTYPPGSTFNIEIHITQLPTGGYTGFQAKLGWTDGVVSYLPTVDPADEALWPECTVVVRANNWEDFGLPTVLLGCFPLVFEAQFDTGAVLTLQLQCETEFSPPGGGSPPNGVGGNQSALTLPLGPDKNGQDGAFFISAAFQVLEPAVTGATVTCGEVPPTPVPTATSTPEPGVSLTGGETTIGVGGSTVLTFTVVDDAGNTVPDVDCTFSIVGATDATLSSATGTTDANGDVSVTLTAGATAETVQVKADCGDFGSFVQDVTVSPALPATGAALEADRGFSVGLWALIGALLVSAAAGLALFGRRSTRVR